MRNILFVTIDALRRDHVGCYGYDRDTTPTIDRLADEGQKVDCLANSPGTRWAFQTLYAGVYTLQIDGIGLPETAGTTVAEALSEAGYDTAAFANNGFLNHLHGMDRGFDVFQGGTRFDRATQTDETTVSRALDWLEDRDGPWYCHVHLMDAHGPWERHDGLLERVRGDKDVEHVQTGHAYVRPGESTPQKVIDAYDVGIASADRQLNRLARFVDDDDAIVVTADHGEELGEFREFHTAHLQWTMTDVPLVSTWDVLDGVEQHLDIPNLLYKFYGASIPETWEGSVFEESEPDFMCVRDEVGAYAGDVRYIRRLDKDTETGPREYREFVDEMIEHCRDNQLGTGHSGKQDDLSDEVSKRLKELGYLE